MFFESANLWVTNGSGFEVTRITTSKIVPRAQKTRGFQGDGLKVPGEIQVIGGTCQFFRIFVSHFSRSGGQGLVNLRIAPLVGWTKRRADEWSA